MRLPPSRFVRSCVCAVLLLIATGARASFHLWVIDQIYSDATGNVQYVEFATTAGGQEFLAGQNLVAGLGTSTRNFTFPANLAVTFPNSTANKKFLVATQGYASLPGAVAPDYIVPNRFLFVPGGTVSFAFSVDSVTYAALPLDGVSAMAVAPVTHAITTVTNSPTNFAGATTSINVPPPAQAGPMDVDRDGSVDPLTDGLLVLRYMFGLRGQALIDGAVGAGAASVTATAIQDYLATCIAGPGNNCVIP